MLMTLLAHEGGWDHVDTFILLAIMGLVLNAVATAAVVVLLIRGWRMGTAVVESLAGLHAALRNHLIYHVAEHVTSEEDEGL